MVFLYLKACFAVMKFEALVGSSSSTLVDITESRLSMDTKPKDQNSSMTTCPFVRRSSRPLMLRNVGLGFTVAPSSGRSSMVGSSFLFPWLQNAQTLSLLNTMPATCVVGKAGTVQAFHHLPSLKSPALLPPAEKPTSGVNAPLPLVPPSSGGCWAADECFASRDGTAFPLC